MELFSPGSRTVAINDVYGGTYRLFSKMYAAKGYSYEFLDLTDEGVARQAFEHPADLVWLETPSNPLLKIVDIAAIAERAHAAGAIVVVDNTFASPYLQQPLSLGADIVVHSTTKYVGGHSDAVGGVAITNDEETAQRLHFVQNSMGPARSTASSPCAGRRRSRCAWSATATTRRRSRAGSRSRLPSAMSSTPGSRRTRATRRRSARCGASEA
jgi:cystathionine beta-lyase/cystathionine gamma-synthase